MRITGILQFNSIRIGRSVERKISSIIEVKMLFSIFQLGFIYSRDYVYVRRHKVSKRCRNQLYHMKVQ